MREKLKAEWKAMPLWRKCVEVVEFAAILLLLYFCIKITVG